MKRILAVLIVFVIVLAGCSGNQQGGSDSSDQNQSGQSTEAQVTIHFWKPPHGDDKEVFAALIEQFEAENPNINVVHTIVPWDSVDQQFATAFAGSNPPDVVYMPDEWFPRYAQEGGLLDITDRFGEIADGWDEEIAEFGQYKGVQYGVPHIVATQGYFFNDDLLAAAGYSEPPTTMEELKEMASEITDASENVYGYFDPMTGFNNQFWGPLFVSAGVELLNEDLTEAIFNTPEAVEVLDFIKTLYDSDATVPRNRFTGDQLDVQLFEGNIAMAFLNYDKVGTILLENPDLNFSVSQNPSYAGQISQAAFYGFMFVSEQSEHKDEAWEFVKFLTNAENLESYAQSVTMFSTRNDSTWWEGEPMAVPFAQALDNSFGAIPTIHWREMSRIIGEEIDYVIAGHKTSQEALDDAETAVNEILDGN